MLLILTAVFAYHNSVISYWYVFCAVNLILVWAIWRLADLYGRKTESVKDEDIKNSSPLKILRYWYGVAAILYIFKQVYIIVFSLKPMDWDSGFYADGFRLIRTESDPVVIPIRESIPYRIPANNLPVLLSHDSRLRIGAILMAQV